MSLIGTLDLAIELKSPADKLWEAFKDFSNVLPKILSHTYHIEVLEGNAMDNGMVVLWKISPCTLVEGAPAMMVEKKKLEMLDETNKTIVYSVIDGDLMKFYKSFSSVMAVKPKVVAKAKAKANGTTDDHDIVNEGEGEGEGKGDNGGGGGGSIVTWSVKFEKVNQMVPDPNISKAIIARTLYIMDAYLLYSQYIQTPQNENIINVQL